MIKGPFLPQIAGKGDGGFLGGRVVYEKRKALTLLASTVHVSLMRCDSRTEP